MLITKRSSYSQQEHTREIPITEKQYRDWLAMQETDNRPHIQHVFPDLSSDDREFLLTGITPEEWDAIFPPEDEDEWEPETTNFEHAVDPESLDHTLNLGTGL